MHKFNLIVLFFYPRGGYVECWRGHAVLADRKGTHISRERYFVLNFHFFKFRNFTNFFLPEFQEWSEELNHVLEILGDPTESDAKMWKKKGLFLFYC